MKRVYICSPYRADSDDELNSNIEFAQAMCRKASDAGYKPVAPHLYYPQFLDDNDPAERKKGLEFARNDLMHCGELWQCGDRVSEGMKAEIKLANELEIPVKYIPRDGEKNGKS